MSDATPAPARVVQAAPDRAEQARVRLVKRIKQVIEIWEAQQGHSLSEERMHEFRKRPEIAELIDFAPGELEACAKLTMKTHDGRLLLAEWLDLAKERRRDREEHQQLLAQLEARRTAAKREERMCKSCNRAVWNCIC